MLFHRATVLLLATSIQYARAQTYTPMNDTFNSTATISVAAANAANLTALDRHNAVVALEFQQTNYATGSVGTDEFYTVPTNSSTALPGDILKIEFNATAKAFSLPPTTAISRILYMTASYNGTAVPASAYILWPYLPRKQPDGTFPVVGFAHGTTGIFGECAPSHTRPLQYNYGVTYTLALQGYVVVAPDFAGLGVNRTATGSPILNPYGVNPAAANDLFYAVQAAQSAFATLSKEFVIVGHSQGGGAAWAAAQRQALKPVAGFLGTVAGSPPTSSSGQVTSNAANTQTIRVAHGLSAVFPDFTPSMWLNELGLARLNLLTQTQGCTPLEAPILGSDALTLPNFDDNFYYEAFANISQNGGKPIGRPMLVLQGTADPTVPANGTTAAVNKTCEAFPATQIEYHLYQDVTHSKPCYPTLYLHSSKYRLDPSMWVSQRTWLGWIEDRFAGKNASAGCSTTHSTAALPLSNYLEDANWYIEIATQVYETNAG